MKGIRKAGFAVSHKASLDSEAAQEFLRGVSAETICVVPSHDNHPYSVVEASLIPGLNLIVTDGGGIPEILGNAARRSVGRIRWIWPPRSPSGCVNP